EKCRNSPLCPIDELIRHNHISGMNFLFHTADGADAQQPFHAELSEAVNVGPIVDLAGEKTVSDAVAREEIKPDSFFQFAGNVGIRGGAERSVDHMFFHAGETFHRVETASTDDSEFFFTHATFSFINSVR